MRKGASGCWCRIAEQPHQSGRVAVADHDQQADEKHARCRGDKVPWIPMFKSRAGLARSVGELHDDVRRLGQRHRQPQRPALRAAHPLGALRPADVRTEHGLLGAVVGVADALGEPRPAARPAAPVPGAARSADPPSA